jgi:hypothetical protein
MTESDHTPPEFYAREPLSERPERPRRSRERPDRGGLDRLRRLALEQRRFRLGALVVVLIAIGFIIWVAVGGSGSSSPSTSASAPAGAKVVAGTPPVSVSYGGLRTLAGALHQPIYWTGTGSTSHYELRQLQNGYVYVRYLPAGVAAGDPRALLTIGTYPMQNAYSITKALSKAAGNIPLDPGGGGVGAYSEQNKTDAYVAFPGSNYQIEVYSPAPGRARRLVARGLVSAIQAGTAAEPGVRAVTPARIKSLARSLGQPIYWAGTQAGIKYELTQTSTGRIFVRYLPAGVPVGTQGRYLTVATYPVTNAYAVTKALGKTAGNSEFVLPGGGVAAYGSASSTTDVYVAFRGEDYQVEVFDPTPGAALKLVQAGQLVTAR